jgi:hypothetical protein
MVAISTNYFQIEVEQCMALNTCQERFYNIWAMWHKTLVVNVSHTKFSDEIDFKCTSS